MADLSPGVYEHLVTRDLERRLTSVDGDLVQRVGLDVADAAEVLSRHVAALARRALRAVPGDSAQRLAGQVALTNDIESATIFLQQVGRGLRLAEGKACLTVLDFIGAQHASFRFDLRYRALTGTSRRTLVPGRAVRLPDPSCRLPH